MIRRKSEPCCRWRQSFSLLRLWRSSRIQPPRTTSCCGRSSNVRAEREQGVPGCASPSTTARRRRPRRTRCCVSAEQQRTQLDAASDRLSDTYQANELRINNLNTELRDKAAALGLAELFGLARQSANDNSSILQQSLITTQFPTPAGELPRDEWLRQFSSARATPTAAELERLWLEIQREMTASGQVAKYRATIVQPGGEPTESEVIRIGPFTAISDGQFLAYLPNLRTLERAAAAAARASSWTSPREFTRSDVGLRRLPSSMRTAACCSGCTSSGRRTWSASRAAS